jgi:hypothetical protein
MEDITILKPKLSRLKLSGVLETLVCFSQELRCGPFDHG